MNYKFYFSRVLIIIISLFISVRAQDTSSWADTFGKARDKAVQVIAIGRPYNWLTPFVQGEEACWSGSGFFTSSEGDIYTNFHVADGAEVIRIQHPLAWKESFEVDFLGGSQEYDCAHLRLKPSELARLKAMLPDGKIEYFHLGDSDQLEQGQKVMLLGYPLGEENIKHAVGTISGQQTTRWGECLTTTAASNPGNSGGPCIDKDGNVVAMLVGGVSNAQGINFLIPINRLKVILDELVDGKVLHKPVWGIRLACVTPQTLQYLGSPTDSGAYVASIKSGFLADQAGIAKGDVISEINGLKVDRFGYVQVPWTKYRVIFSDILARIKNGDIVEFTTYRQGEKIICSVVKTAESLLKIQKLSPPFDQGSMYDVFGGVVVMELAANHFEIFESVARRFLDESMYLPEMRYLDDSNRKESRLMITHIFTESDLSKNNVFEPVDRIISKVNGLDVKTIDDFHQAVLAGAQSDSDYLVIETERGGLAAIPLIEALQQEMTLSEKYGYQLSPLFFTLVPDDVLSQLGFEVEVGEPVEAIALDN